MGVQEILKQKNIKISLKYFGKEDWATGWDVKCIVDNQELFNDFYNIFPLNAIENIDDYYLFLLTNKFLALRDIIPEIVSDEHKNIVKNLSDKADVILSSLTPAPVIKYINEHYADLLDKNIVSHEIMAETIEYIIKYSNGMEKNVFLHLCNTHGYVFFYRFAEMEKTLENNPDLFELLVKKGNYDN